MHSCVFIKNHDKRTASKNEVRGVTRLATSHAGFISLDLWQSLAGTNVLNPIVTATYNHMFQEGRATREATVVVQNRIIP